MKEQSKLTEETRSTPKKRAWMQPTIARHDIAQHVKGSIGIGPDGQSRLPRGLAS